MEPVNVEVNYQIVCDPHSLSQDVHDLCDPHGGGQDLCDSLVHDNPDHIKSAIRTEDPLHIHTHMANVNSVLETSISAEDPDEDIAGQLKEISESKPSLSGYTINSKNQSTCPGVILLGRGNSFCLGRSEVIVLNNRKPARSSKAKVNDSVTIDERSHSMTPKVTHRTNTHWSNEHTDLSLHSQTPPPISNESSENVSILEVDEESNCDSFSKIDLDNLWRKAESVMFAKQEAVLKVLEDFGIGEAGGGEEDEERMIEEESVWQVVQENFEV